MADRKPPPPEAVPGIKSIVLVASGKGGVGKSTVAINLAITLSGQGKKVGILDADIYGPSLPMLVGLKARAAVKDHKIIPIEQYGLKTMSLGFLNEGDGPAVWRGPMVAGAVGRMMADTAWGELDILIVDMPPGTGDAHLSIAQKFKVAGAVVVCTPQDLALIDARKAIGMFEKVNIPILGLVENMSTFECPHCHKTTDIFGCNGVKLEAEKIGVPFLGAIPLKLEIRTSADVGRPISLTDPSSYQQIAEKVLKMLD